MMRNNIKRNPKKSNKAISKMKSLIGCFFFVSLLCGSARLVYAMPLAGEVISNTVVVNFRIDKDKYPTLFFNELANAKITIDAKLNLDVSSNMSSALEVLPNQVDSVLSYTVTNLSNSVNDIFLDAIVYKQSIDTLQVNYFDFINNDHRVYVDVNDDNQYQMSIDTAQVIDDLNPNESKTVFVVTSTPVSLPVDGVAAVALVAQIANLDGAVINRDNSGNVSPSGAFAHGVITQEGIALITNKNDNIENIEYTFADAEDQISSDGSLDTARNGQASDVAVLKFKQNPAAISHSGNTVDCTSRDEVKTSLGEVYENLCVEYTVTINAIEDSKNLIMTVNMPVGSDYVTSSMELDDVSITDKDDVDIGAIVDNKITFSFGDVAKTHTHKVTYLVRVKNLL
jgi:hypothetical protein